MRSRISGESGSIGDTQGGACEFQVIIVGAGPTGLAAANLLGLYGIKTLLLEQRTGLYTFPRAITIDDQGLRICQALGVGKEVLSQIRMNLPVRYISHNQTIVRVVAKEQEYGYPLISTFDQPEFESLLQQSLTRFPHVQVLFGHTLHTIMQHEEEVHATIRTADGEVTSLTCAYLLGCDGGKSQVRQITGTQMAGKTFTQRWLVVDGQHDEKDAHITFFCGPTRPAVSVPAPQKRWRWEFMVLPGEQEETLIEPTQLHKLIQSVGGPREPYIRRHAFYTFHATQARDFAHGRVFLLGDAAHLLPPFGGQGMNLGLREAQNLTWKLALCLQQKASRALLTSYQQECAPYAQRMSRFSSRLGQVIMPTNPLLAYARDGIVWAVQRLPPRFATLLTEARVKPDSRYRQGGLIPTRHYPGRSLVGRLLPQPVVKRLLHEKVLLDEVAGSGFALFRLHDQPDQAFKNLHSPIWSYLETRFVCVLPTQTGDVTPTNECTCIIDHTQKLARFFQHCQDIYVLVRPDHYVMGVFRPEGEDAFVTSLHRWIHQT